MRITDRQIADIIDSMVVIVDTREQKNDHILMYLKDNGIKYKIEKLDSGDYSFVLPNHPELNFDKKILLEKKNSLTEIAGNFGSARERFAREFERVPEDSKIHLVIEDATWKKLLNGSYRSEMSPQSMMASMLTWNIRYDVPIWFVGKDESPTVIYNIMKYELMEYLKELRS